MASAQPPGPELFAKEPKTPLELWDAIDYLVRTGQSAKAVPYIDKFIKSKPDATVLMAIRDRYGPGSVLRLGDNPATHVFVQPLTEAMIKATGNYVARPERIAHFINQLTKTPAEHDYAVRHLRQAGPYAVPFLIDALVRPGGLPTDREQIVLGIGELDRSAIPALIAVLNSADPSLAVDTVAAIRMIGDPTAVPFLTYTAAAPSMPPAVRTAAQSAIGELTGRPFSAQLQSPVRVLTDAAWRYHRHQAELPDDPVTVWAWDREHHTLTPNPLTQNQAEVVISSQFAQQAIQLAPNDRQAQIAQLSIALNAAVNDVGLASFPTKHQPLFAAAKAAGQPILTEVLQTAIADGKTDLATAVVMILGSITDAAALAQSSQPHPLVNALLAPDRRVQITAAKAITDLAPAKPFAGSSRVVQTLVRFLIGQPLPRAVVIDGNPNRGSQLAGFLGELRYDPELELTGNLGFRAATASADVQLILVSFDLFRPGWGLHDTLANLATDPRTSSIPVFIYGPLTVKYNRPNLEQEYPHVKFLVQPGEADMLQKQLRGLPVALSEVERAKYAAEAAACLAHISADRKGPLAPDLATAEPILSSALNRTDIAPAVAATLGSIPQPDAQRSLATVVLDPSRTTDLRRKAADHLVRSIQQFGHLLTAYQEARLTQIVAEETNSEMQNSIKAIIQALRRPQRAGLNRPAPRVSASMLERMTTTAGVATPNQ